MNVAIIKIKYMRFQFIFDSQFNHCRCDLSSCSKEPRFQTNIEHTHPILSVEWFTKQLIQKHPTNLNNFDLMLLFLFWGTFSHCLGRMFERCASFCHQIYYYIFSWHAHLEHSMNRKTHHWNYHIFLIDFGLWTLCKFYLDFVVPFNFIYISHIQYNSNNQSFTEYIPRASKWHRDIGFVEKS